MFQVYCANGDKSIVLEELDEAKEWAWEAGMDYEIIDMEKGRVAWTHEDDLREELEAMEDDGQPTEYEEWMSFDPDC